MSDKREEDQTKSEQEQRPFRRRGGWLRRTATPTGERPLGPPPATPPPNTPESQSGAE